MKTLRTFTIIVTLLIIGGLSMAGCEDGNASNNQETITNNEQSEPQAKDKSMDSNEKKQVLDSINVLVSQINNLIDISTEITNLKRKSHLFDWISWGFAVMALLVAAIAIIKLNSVQKRVNRDRNELEGLRQRIRELKQQCQVLSSTISSIESASRISAIEQQHQRQTAEQQIKHTTVPEDRKCTYERHGYFGLPIQMPPTDVYFYKLNDTKAYDSRFTVTIKDDEAEFRPLEGTKYLNDLKSNDAIKLALDIQGCAPSVATQMRVEAPGKARKDSSRWIITKKVKITLSK